MSLEYGIIGNCRTAALISRNGSINWCCMPDFDSTSVFAKILDEGTGGTFAIQPIGTYKISQQYAHNTNLLETIFSNSKHKFVMIDFFERYRENGNIARDNRIYRIVRVLKGNPKVIVNFDPKMNYAQGKTIKSIKENCIEAHDTDFNGRICLNTNVSLGKIMNKDPIELKGNSYFIVSHNSPIEINEGYIENSLKKTIEYWNEFVRKASWPQFYKKQVIRSALALKLLTYDKTGAIIAAATTSLPEIIGKERNWDYRYCWLRDGSFTINALTRICHFDEAQSFMNFLEKVLLQCDEADIYKFVMQIMYGINGETEITERILERLSGYKDSRPVRVGNAAYKQKQIDVAGEVIDTICEYYVEYSYEDKLPGKIWGIIEQLISFVFENWKEKDNGIWEFRGIREHFTHSKLMCWVALDRAIKIAEHFKVEYDKSWERLKEEIREEILAKSWNEGKKAFTIYYGSDELDASVLLMPYYGFIEPKDKRMLLTLEAIEKELVEGCLVLRYRMRDDFGKPKNSFSICTFWYIDALYLAGQKKKAKKFFQQMLRYSNRLGLFSEDIDLETKELTGNFPQAYTHIALIYCAILLSGKGTRRLICSTDNEEFKLRSSNNYEKVLTESEITQK